MPAFTKYNSFLKNQMNGGGGTPALVVDFDTDTIKLMLVSSAYTPNAATHSNYSHIANEVTGTGYTAGGETISNPTLTETAGVITFGGDNITWAQNPDGFTNARYAILYKATGVAPTSALIGYYDFVTDQSTQIIPFSAVFSGGVITQWQ